MKVILLNTDTGLPLCFPDSAVIADGTPYFFTEDPGHTQVRMWCGVVIERLGKGIGEQFAPRYYSKTVCGTFNSEAGADTGSNLMRDGAICAGRTPLPSQTATITAGGCTAAVPPAQVFDRAIAFVSQLATLKTGDIVAVPVGPALTLPHGQKHDLYIDSDNARLLHAKYR